MSRELDSLSDDARKAILQQNVAYDLYKLIMECERRNIRFLLESDKNPDGYYLYINGIFEFDADGVALRYSTLEEVIAGGKRLLGQV